jgi:hypothetical protein
LAKWFDETILIKYWEDRCARYSLQDGTAVKSAVRNRSFGRYPDIQENYLSDGRVVPAEIEWTTTDFDRHGHDISLLMDQSGFLIVFVQDSGFPVEQVEIDEADFRKWYEDNAGKLCQETLAEIRKLSKRSREPQIFLFYIPRSGGANFRTALEHGVWGFPVDNRGVARGLAKISQIKKNDIVVFVRNWRSLPSATVSGGRLSARDYVGTYEQIVGVTVTRGFYKAYRPRIWPDNEYPYRFRFRREPLFVGTDIPCNPKDLGKSLHEILRKLQVSGSVEKIDSSMIVKLMSLCT